MNLIHRLQVVTGRQIAVGEGLELLTQAQRELTAARSSADAWAFVGVLSSLILIPANCIINAFELKTATSVYQLLVRAVYSRVAASGTRQSGLTKSMLAALKKAIVDELSRKGLGHYVPGVNILIGLAEDSAALADVVATVDSGTREMHRIAADLDRKIATARAQLTALGIERAAIMDRLQVIGRTA